MARVAKTNVESAKNKFTVSEVLEYITLNTVTIKKNSNGKEGVIIPGHGMTYMNIAKIEANVLYKLVRLKSDSDEGDGAIALNEPTEEEVRIYHRNKLVDEIKFYKEQFPEMTVAEIKDMFGL